MREIFMSTDRRSFLERVAMGTLGIGAINFDSLRPPSTPFDPIRPAADWDLSWTSRLIGQRKAVYDVPEIESGYGVWRAVSARAQFMSVFKLAPSDVNMVVVLRHSAISLAMSQAFWDKYNVGKDKKVTDPLSEQPTTHNPVVERSGAYALPAEFSGMALEPFMASGGIVLACAVAFGDCIARVKSADKVDDAEAEKRAKAMLVPGVILQPSGVFAAQLAQDFGCRYVRAS
jgi:hypothetical protein